VIGDVRGKGLFIAIEIVEPGSLAPDARLAKELSNEALKEGLLLSATGAHGNNLRITPPLVITPDQVERSLRGLRAIFSRLAPGG